MSNIYKALKRDSSTIKLILGDPLAFDGWSLQGFGMLRLYLTKEIRLHIWDSRFMVPNVSLIHNHPWDFESFVVSGLLRNYRYRMIPLLKNDPTEKFDFYSFSTIKCGPGGGIRSVPEMRRLVESESEVIYPGETYHQKSEELHKSVPRDGTVTLIEREFKADTEHAQVFWPHGQEWVSAEPRPATQDEIIRITSLALDEWHKNYRPIPGLKFILKRRDFFRRLGVLAAGFSVLPAATA